MAAISASMVAELRGKTDAPMMECKRALTEAEGDMVKAEELLRVKLGTKAGKAAGRVTAEGVVAHYRDGDVGALIEVNCETDFVTKNDSFLALANAAAELVAKHNPADIAALGALPYAQDGFGPTLEEDMKLGVIDSLVVQHPFKMGYESVKSAVASLDGKQVEKINSLAPRLVSKDNLSDPEVQAQVHPDLKKYLD